MIQFLNNTFRPIELNYELIVTDRFILLVKHRFEDFER